MTDKRDVSGLDLNNLGDRGEDPGGTGGQSGGGTTAGAGRPAGGTLESVAGQAPSPAHDVEAMPHRDTLAGIADNEIAGEAAALGSADGGLADAAGLAGHRQGGTPTMGEAIGAGAGRGEPGSGTPGDHGDLGGGDPMRVAE